MPTFQKCPKEIYTLAQKILQKHESHAPLLDAKVRIDLVFAFADISEKTNEPTNCALSKNGVKALGICKKIGLKERALDHGDAEIALDGDWWAQAGESEREALLDHELHHIEVRVDERGILLDDLKRPMLRMRKHDFEFGWFNLVAQRNGMFSLERQQARKMLESHGQLYWPEIAGTHTDVVEVSARAMRSVARA